MQGGFGPGLPTYVALRNADDIPTVLDLIKQRKTKRRWVASGHSTDGEQNDLSNKRTTMTLVYVKRHTQVLVF